jgi:hypothetical protein
MKKNCINEKGIDWGRIKTTGGRHQPDVWKTPQNHLQPFMKITIGKKVTQLWRSDVGKSREPKTGRVNGGGAWLTRAPEKELKRSEGCRRMVWWGACMEEKGETRQSGLLSWRKKVEKNKRQKRWKRRRRGKAPSSSPNGKDNVVFASLEFGVEKPEEKRETKPFEELINHFNLVD